ncbi:RNA-guided endonuclease InsQ/TnpB family protein [Oscillatoria acuminata]|uniref:Transposase n=1 Tax=Oscillatoria acuminata PCC 6304 TaxID=56110 RepID=K9TR41_9CYAN|nr:RNA-guided endonuclease TnpB family protein [Oscillatoria acuminata]AFY84853.1 transposase [Oscillatoria acuminata PCC 6304]
MKLAYQYKLLPAYQQRCRMDKWLDMLRCQYNYLLAARFDWWEMNRCPVNACPLVCSIAEPRKQPEYYGQKRSLVSLKQERSWYADIHADVLQDMVKRVDLAFVRLIKGDKNGKRSGKPRFKGKNRYRTFAYQRVKPDCIQGNGVMLPKLGEMKFIQHRSIPDGFTIKRALVTKKADGWYVTLTLEDQAVPELPINEIQPTEANSIGVDAGLEYFIACSDGETKQPPKFYRQAEEKLGKLQAKRDARAKGSKPRRRLNERIAKLHQRIARQRQQWHFETAQELIDKAEVIFIEELKVSNMVRRNKPKQGDDGTFLPNGQSAKSGLNKSFADAGIAGFLNDILPYKAAKAGRLVVKVNPAGTSQHCAMCLNRVPKELSDRWHECPYCGASMPRDVNSGMLIKKVGLGVRLTIKRESLNGRRSPHRNA